MQARVLITRALPESALALLREACEVQYDASDQALTPAALRQAVVGKEGLLCLVTDRIDAAVLEAGTALKVVSTVAVGYDNIDVSAATQRGIVVTNTPGVVTESTADLTWALLCSVARRIAEGDRYIRAGKWRSWHLLLMAGTDIHGKTLGIFGMGRIGQAVARRARGFNMRVLYHNRQPLDTALETELNATWVEKQALLQQADYLSVHVPLSQATTHLIGPDELRLMRPTAYLINAARGPVVDEAALIQALQQGWIAGAALDVFEDEPQVPQALLEMENVVMVPHIGSASVATRTRMAVMAAENLLAVLNHTPTPHMVNPEALARRAAARSSC
ncbi:MAG: 2-hydroxyacid dehydrogenase [Candidatus Tectimicrobiota bacterium]